MTALPPAAPLAGPWENISATELADVAGYFARKVAAEPVTFDAVTLRWFRLMEVVGAHDLDLFFGLESEDAVC